MTIIRWGLPVLAAIALVPVANATIVNFSVHQSPDDDINVTSANLSGPNGVAAGVETWNLNNYNNGASQSGLLNAAGAATGIGFNTDLGGPDDWGYGASLKLLWRSGRNFDTGAGNSASFTITGLDPGSVYDLWIATAHVGQDATGTWSTTNANSTGASLPFDNTANNSNGSTWVLGSTYELFQSVAPTAGGSITMTVQSGTGQRVGFQGFQLATVVPEPSSALLGGLGLLGLLRRRRA